MYESVTAKCQHACRGSICMSEVSLMLFAEALDAAACTIGDTR